MEQRLVNLYNQQAMFCYGNVEWSHKIHEKAADLFTTVNSWLRWIQLILAFIISADIIKQFGTDSPVISGILIGCSLILTLINTITKSFDFNGRASRHIMTANALWDLREDYRSFKYDIQAGRYNEDELRIKRDELQKRVKEIYKTAPRTFSWAYKKAEKAFNEGQVTFDHLDEK